MFETPASSTFKETNFNNLSINIEDSNIELEECNEDSSSLWCIEDDTLFYAQSLKHHSAGKGKSVYVTWNENYLLNFVFKTSLKKGTTTLTKVRISMPVHEQQLEEISNMLILEMNTLLYMKSGRVYYFSSFKSLHKVDWLTGIRCASSFPHTKFSVIRLLCSSDHGECDQNRLLCLEVYKDVPQLGKCCSKDVLRHSYDISFDLENLFNCDWLDETYTLVSLITDDRNITFLKQLVSVGNIFRSQVEIIDLVANQEVHIFTISGNMFILVGAIVSEGEPISSYPQVEGFSLRLLNTYACPIECTKVDCENNLLIVLLQSGHMDIWYKSTRMLGALFHCQHEISGFLGYDYWPTKNIFYFTTPEEVIQLKIGFEKECKVEESRKYMSGMIACTFVEGMQQLICISINNIFYRISFTTLPETIDNNNVHETKYENLNHLYDLNLKRVNDLRAKAQIIDELMKQPIYLHNAIEKEFQKQQILALESKSEIFKKLFQCHLEYHLHLPGVEYFNDDCIHIKATGHQSQQLGAQTIFCLIFVSSKNHKSNFKSTVFTGKIWYLHISNFQQCQQLYIPFDMLNKKLCFIVDIPVEQHAKQTLPTFALNLLTFFNHRCYPLSLKFNLRLDTNENTYVNLFSYNIKNVPIFPNSYDDIKNLLTNHSNRVLHTNNKMECGEKVVKIKQYYKVQKIVLQNMMEQLKAKSPWSLGMNFKIYYLHNYSIELNYDDSQEILLISSNYPVAIFYIKLLLMRIMQSYNDVDTLDILDTSVHNMQQKVMNYESDIENLYGADNTSSMHLEKLLNVYLKLRTEFYDISR